MAKVVLFMAMSLDGFIAGPDDTASEPAGRGGERLFAWSDDEAPATALHAEYEATGAVPTTAACSRITPTDCPSLVTQHGEW